MEAEQGILTGFLHTVEMQPLPLGEQAHVGFGSLPLVESGQLACLDGWPVLRKAVCRAGGAAGLSEARFLRFLAPLLKKHCPVRISPLGSLGNIDSSTS